MALFSIALVHFIFLIDRWFCEAFFFPEYGSQARVSFKKQTKHKAVKKKKPLYIYMCL